MNRNTMLQVAGLFAVTLAGGAALLVAGAADSKTQPILGVPCETPPPARCADAPCAASIGNLGNAVETKTGRADLRGQGRRPLRGLGT